MRDLMKSVVFGSRDCASGSGDSTLSASDSNGVVGRRH